jgi:hypothetical protein
LDGSRFGQVEKYCSGMFAERLRETMKKSQLRELVTQQKFETTKMVAIHSLAFKIFYI